MKATKARSCTGKHQHKTRNDAMDHLWNLRRKDAAVRMHAYRCKFCKYYHVGHYRRRN